jgi:cytidine deaminase
MKKEHRFDFESYEGLAGMAEADRELTLRAREACAGSFSPYSGFKVGAAARLRSGAVVTASNQESEVFPEGMCAERILLWEWQAHHADDPIEALAIASVPDERECYPCGGCRQVLLDVERRQGSPIRVIMSSGTTASVVGTAQDLLPFGFTL